MEHLLRIADIPLQVESGAATWFSHRYAAYARQDGEPPQLVMHTRLQDTIAVPAGEPVAQESGLNLVRLADGRLCRYARNKAGQVVVAITYSPDYSRVDICLRVDWQSQHHTLQEYEYMYTGFSFHNRLTVLGGGVLHGSAICWRGHGVVLSADSGVGKSTHAGLWKQVYGDEVVILNDDKPAIRFMGDKPWVYGTPWSGKTALNCNEAAPLEAIVFLERGERNAIRPLDAVEGMYRLSGQIARPYYDAALGERVVDFTRRLLETVPLYCLSCTISEEAVDTVCRALFPNEEGEI
ncbi:MAG: hypothetical protein IJO76_08085 [Clostridia bacterium]|nr:hypothetical protein [Clostridia bacterium]